MRENLAFFLLFSLLSLNVFFAVGSASPTLAKSEVNALRRIAEKLGKTDWDFGVDPCSGGRDGSVRDATKIDVFCDCSFINKSRCYIISLSLKGRNLSGVLPGEFGLLRHLQQLDLSRNVLNGSIPEQWAGMRLQGLSLMGNRLSGPFPIVLTAITTLTNLSIEGNRFTGPLPPKLGDLVHLEKLVLSSNEFTGMLPEALAKLTNLTDLRISDNNFSGKIPEFIKNLTRLERLQIEGCSLEGPIPSGISSLTRMTDLRISDLSGKGSTFPKLSQMKSLKALILRNCSIHGDIPAYIGSMTMLKHLDLSFNKFTGEIPGSFASLVKVDFIYLTANMLTGTIPGWILKRNKNVDISYNNFTVGSSGPTQCLGGSVNTAECYSPAADNISTVNSCLKRDFPCSASNKQYQHSLHINCGGQETIIKGMKYEADTEERGASTFYLGPNWAFSSTGDFMDNDANADNYISTNTSILSMLHPQLYTKK